MGSHVFPATETPRRCRFRSGRGDSSGTSLRDDHALTEGGVKATPCPQPRSSGLPPTLRRDDPDGSRRGLGGLLRRGVSGAEESLALLILQPSRRSAVQAFSAAETRNQLRDVVLG